MEDPMSHKDALWRYRVVNFGNTTEKTFLGMYLNRSHRIKELEGLVKGAGAPIDTEGYFKLRKTLKDMKLQRKQQSGYYRMIMDRCKLRVKAYERKQFAKPSMGLSGRNEHGPVHEPVHELNTDSPADHDMAQHPLNSDLVGG